MLLTARDQGSLAIRLGRPCERGPPETGRREGRVNLASGTESLSQREEGAAGNPPDMHGIVGPKARSRKVGKVGRYVERRYNACTKHWTDSEHLGVTAKFGSCIRRTCQECIVHVAMWLATKIAPALQGSAGLGTPHSANQEQGFSFGRINPCISPAPTIRYNHRYRTKRRRQVSRFMGLSPPRFREGNSRAPSRGAQGHSYGLCGFLELCAWLAVPTAYLGRRRLGHMAIST